MRLMTAEARGQNSDIDERGNFHTLETLASKLLKVEKIHWDDAFARTDSQYQTDARGMGEAWIKHLREYERTLQLHRMEAFNREEHEVDILGYVKGEMSQRILIDDTPVMFIHPYLHLSMVEMLTAGFIAEDAVIEHGLTATDIVRDMDFLNSNFHLGLRMETRTVDERAFITIKRPETTKVVVQ